ncbi:MAG: hypothetical protein K2R98_18610 [Gemmataceae bacterium]|nr:hypothetical protein [Gemmataceae bacterium]
MQGVWTVNHLACAYDFTWQMGTWYWFQLKMEDGVLYGKVWTDGDAEPTTWLFTQRGWANRSGGAVALNGGSAGSGGSATDDVAIRQPG